MSPLRAVREWAAGLDFLLQNPANCSAVELLQTGAVIALALVALRETLAALALLIMRRRARPVSPGSPIAGTYERAVARLRVRRAPRLLTLREAPAPMFIAGIWRPFIVADERAVPELTEDELQVALLHELAHFRRRDNLRSALSGPLMVGATALTIGAIVLQTSFAHSLFRFDLDEALPLVALLPALAIAFARFTRGRLAHARELACDDETIRATGDPLLLASALLSFAASAKYAQTQARRSSIMAAQRHACLVEASTVELRVRRLLAYRPPSRRRALGAQLFTLALLPFMFAALVTR